MIKLSNEMLEKAKTAKTAEELIELAKAEGVELSQEEAARYFSELHKTGELSDDELDNVAGGCDEETDDPPKFCVGQRVKVTMSVGGVDYYHEGCIRQILWKVDGYLCYKVLIDDGLVIASEDSLTAI